MKAPMRTFSTEAEKAKEEGIAEGIFIGEAKGIERRNIEVAINMIKQKLDNKLISSVTGLTLEEILKLKNKN